MSERAGKVASVFGILCLWIMTWSDQFRLAALESRGRGGGESLT